MSGVNPQFQDGPRTFEVSAAVTGGQIVERSTTASTTGLPVVRPAAADSVTCQGVAAKDAQPVSAQAGFQNGTVGYSDAPFTDVSVINETTAVYGSGAGVHIKVKAGSALTERQPIKCGALGTAVPWVDGTDAVSRRIGYCSQVGGISSGSQGLCFIQAQA